MLPSDRYLELKTNVQPLLNQIPENTWFTYNGTELLKVGVNLAIPKQQFVDMGLHFSGNETSPTLNFERFCKFLSFSDTARTKNLETIEKQRQDLRKSRSECCTLQTKLGKIENKFSTQEAKLQALTNRVRDADQRLETINDELSSKSIELSLKEAEIGLKQVEILSKDEQISRLQALQKPATSSSKFHLITSPRVIIPVGTTIGVLELVAHQSKKPKLAPSYWAKKGACVVGKLPSKLWNSIFDSTDANLTTGGSGAKDDIVSSNICEEAIFDLSLNSEYKAVQSQGVSTNPPTGLIRPPYISLFSFTL